MMETPHRAKTRCIQRVHDLRDCIVFHSFNDFFILLTRYVRAIAF